MEEVKTILGTPWLSYSQRLQQEASRSSGILNSSDYNGNQEGVGAESSIAIGNQTTNPNQLDANTTVLGVTMPCATTPPGIDTCARSSESKSVTFNSECFANDGPARPTTQTNYTEMSTEELSQEDMRGFLRQFAPGDVSRYLSLIHISEPTRPY